MKEKESDKEKIDRVERGVANGSSLAGKLIDLAKIASAPTSGIAAPFPGAPSPGGVSGGLAGWLVRKIFKK